MAQREYYIGKRKRVIEQLDEVVAMRLVSPAGDSRAPATPVDPLGTPVARAARGHAARSAIPGDVASAFARANWHFVLPTAAVRADLATRSAAAASVEDVGRVFQRADGSIAVATDVLTVQLRPDLSDDQAKAALRERDLNVIRPLPFAPNTYEVRAIGRPDSLAASQELQGDDRFIFAEPVFQEQISGRAAPDDPRYPDQWQWHNTALPGADVHLEAAWQHTRGQGIRVAVIDNGFDAGHPDLVAGVGEASGFFTANGTFTPGTAGMPNNNHGTFCAGMVGARADNGLGGVGAAPDCSLVLVACLPDQIGAQTTLARAVAYAADPTLENPTNAAGSGADIIACSLGPNGAVWEMQTVLALAIEYAARQGRGGRGCPIFWATSNGRNVDIQLDEVVSHSDVIAVGRSTRFDTEHDSARGPKLEYLAPGVDVLSTTSGGGYGFSTGTSFAAPCAAGVAALVVGANPALDRDTLRQLIVASCDKIGDVPYDAQGRNDDYGHGRVNAEAAVLAAVAAGGTIVAAAAGGADLHRLELRAASVAELRDFLDGADLDLGCRPAVRRQGDGEFVVEAYGTMPQIDGLRSARRSAGVTIDVLENTTQLGRARQGEVGRQNRFAGARELPRGLGIKE